METLPPLADVGLLGLVPADSVGVEGDRVVMHRVDAPRRVDNQPRHTYDAVYQGHFGSRTTLLKTHNS